MGLGLGLEVAGERAAKGGGHPVTLVPSGQLVA